MKASVKIIGQIVVVFVFSSALALLVNGARKGGLPLVRPFPPQYQCPSRMKEGQPMPVKEALKAYGREGAVFVDARAKASYDKGHVKDAINLSYSFLDAVPPEAVDRLSRYRWIVVYCNTEREERSRLMAGELSEAGLQDVSYLEGGFLDWVKAGGPYTGQKPLDYEQ
jgi:rhodanese-related sulfurtransferase